MRWIRRAESLSALGSIRITHADLKDIRRRREYLYALILPFAHRKTAVPSRALTELNRDTAALSDRRILRRRGAKVEWAFQGSGAERLAHAIVSDAAELLVTGLCKRIRQRQDAFFGWLYLDRSRMNNRRWCSRRDGGIYRSDAEQKAGSSLARQPPALIGVDEFQPAIPWRVDLHQSPPPLHRPASECDRVVLQVENVAANGEQTLNCLSQPRGQPQRVSSATSS
jgi:predicted RNA-binding Zn ribbon-like protein